MTNRVESETAPILPLLLTVREAAAYLGLHEVVVKALVESGELNAKRISARVNRIPRIECERYAGTLATPAYCPHCGGALR